MDDPYCPVVRSDSWGMTGASEVDAVDSLYHKQQAETASSKTQKGNNTNCWFLLQTELQLYENDSDSAHITIWIPLSL